MQHTLQEHEIQPAIELVADLPEVRHQAGCVTTPQTQAVWRDPETGYERRALSPASERLLQLTEVDLPPGARVSFPASAYTFIHQQIWMLSGTLTFHEGNAVPIGCAAAMVRLKADPTYSAFVGSAFRRTRAGLKTDPYEDLNPAGRDRAASPRVPLRCGS